MPSTFYLMLSTVYLDAATSYLLPFTLYLGLCLRPSTLYLRPSTSYLLPSTFCLLPLYPFTFYLILWLGPRHKLNGFHGLVQDTSSYGECMRKLFLHAKMHVHSPKGMDLLAKKAQMVPDNYPSSRKAQATQNQMHSTKLPCTPDSCITFFAMRPKLLVNLPWPA